MSPNDPDDQMWELQMAELANVEALVSMPRMVIKVTKSTSWNSGHSCFMKITGFHFEVPLFREEEEKDRQHLHHLHWCYCVQGLHPWN